VIGPHGEHARHNVEQAHSHVHAAEVIAAALLSHKIVMPRLACVVNGRHGEVVQPLVEQALSRVPVAVSTAAAPPNPKAAIYKIALPYFLLHHRHRAQTGIQRIMCLLDR
jgi:hypothetical protein